MYKKLICIFLCAAFLVPATASVYEELLAEYFAADFDNGEMPDGTKTVFGDGGYIYADDGALYIEASDTYPPLSTVLFPFDVQFDEYVYECDVRIVRVLSPSCFLALDFGAQSDEYTYQFAVKCGTRLEESLSLMHRNSGSSWYTYKSASLSGYIDDGLDIPVTSDGTLTENVSLHLSVAVKNNTVFCYINGVLVMEDRVNGSVKGFTGVSARGVTAYVDNVSVNANMPRDISAADTFSSELYSLQTGIAAPPAVIKRDKTVSSGYGTGQKRPDIMLISVKSADGVLKCYDGAVELGTLDSRLRLLNGAVLPAFYVSDENTARMLSTDITERSENDSFVVLSKVSLSAYFSSQRYVRTVLDISSRDNVTPAEIYGLLFKNGIRAVILSERAADPETVFSLHKMQVTVWVSCSDAVSAFDAAVAGADAVITGDEDAVISAFESITDNTVLRSAVVISDGGDTSMAPAGTPTAVTAAFAEGASAVRLGVRMTKDGVAVISGDDVTYGMSSELVISESSLSSLRSLTYVDRRAGADERIPTLEEIFESVYKDHPDAIMYFEVCSEGAVDALEKLSGEYSMKDRCLVMSDASAVLKKAMSYGFATAYTDGPYVWDGREKGLSLSLLCETLVKFNSAYNGSSEGITPELLHAAFVRGIPAYISDDGASVYSSVISGCSGVTVQTPARVSKLIKELYAQTDGQGRLSARLRYYDGTELDVTALCGIFPVSGSVSLNGGVVSGSGVYTVYCPQTSEDGLKFCVCSLCMSVSDEGDDAQTTDGMAATGADTLTVITIVAASVLVLGGVVLLLILGKNRKKDEKQD